ncbi:GTP cyclohydrolase II [Amphritea japonica]|uniref:GTP cyclohydrolase-2 n=1 Tax=Amphritea japonica ATCC BAA-1530 TaxID=1278309 RepID=A0A7R6SRA2_9GAMM|nr:GTP cyclohydrolase II [Amphritea japonica]BBB24925.1 GTP cyclohydrolase II [Amphritea japonica ATCC BAA-1530]
MSVKYVASSKLPTPWGVFTMVGFEDLESGKEHVALTFGELDSGKPVLARIHSECLTGDALFSLRCDCGFQLQEALKRISEEGAGVLLYLRQEGRGIGLLNKIKAYHLQDGGADTVEANEKLGFAADMRDYSMCKLMLEHLNIQSVNLMTNNPRKVKALEKYGLNVAARVPLQVGKNRHNEEYLATKMGKLGHLMSEHHFQDDD